MPELNGILAFSLKDVKPVIGIKGLCDLDLFIPYLALLHAGFTDELHRQR
jgi:hypothetical protein